VQVTAPFIFVLGLLCCLAMGITGNPWFLLGGFACLLGGLYTLGD
jgi:hypothetical protein